MFGEGTVSFILLENINNIVVIMDSFPVPETPMTSVRGSYHFIFKFCRAGTITSFHLWTFYRGIDINKLAQGHPAGKQMSHCCNPGMKF
jgi:hypothetical protein